MLIIHTIYFKYIIGVGKLCLANKLSISEILGNFNLDITALYLGFTASTGGLNQTHELISFSFEEVYLYKYISI